MNDVKEKCPGTAATVQSTSETYQGQNSTPFSECKDLHEKLRRLDIVLSIAANLLRKKEYNIDPFEPQFHSLIEGAMYENHQVMTALKSIIEQEALQP